MNRKYIKDNYYTKKEINRKISCASVCAYTAEEASALNLGTATKLIYVTDTNGTFTNTGLWFWDGSAWVDADQTGVSGNIYTANGTIPAATTRTISFGDGTSELVIDNVSAAAVHITGKLTVDGAIDPTWLNFSGQQVDASVQNNSIYVTDGSSSGATAGNIVFKDSGGNYADLEGGGGIGGSTGATDNAILTADGVGGSTAQGTIATLNDDGDLTIYNVNANGNPEVNVGSSVTERFQILTQYFTGNNEIEYVEFSTATANGTADAGEFRFTVDGTEICRVEDLGIRLTNTGGRYILSESSQYITSDTGGIIHNIPTGDVHEFQINSNPEFEVNANGVRVIGSNARYSFDNLSRYINGSSAGVQFYVQGTDEFRFFTGGVYQLNMRGDERIELFGRQSVVGDAYGGTTAGEGVLRFNDATVQPEGTLTSGGLLFTSGLNFAYHDDAGDQYNLNNPKHVLQVEVDNGATPVSTGDGNNAVSIPSFLDGYNLVNVVATVEDKGVTGTTDVQVRRWRAGAAVDMLSTAVTIGDEWFAEDGVINATNDDVQTGDRIYIDVDAVHSGTAPNGLSVALEFEKPI